jgi:hypothetical protein
MLHRVVECPPNDTGHEGLDKQDGEALIPRHFFSRRSTGVVPSSTAKGAQRCVRSCLPPMASPYFSESPVRGLSEIRQNIRMESMLGCRELLAWELDA